MNRASGVLMHISSLYGDYSIGSFGKEAKEFIDFFTNFRSSDDYLNYKIFVDYLLRNESFGRLYVDSR